MKEKKYYEKLLNEIIISSNESEWLEFKHNNSTPETIGQNISAISNSLMLLDREKGYIIWGIDDKKHDIIGTDFDYQKAKKGNESLVLWLSHMLAPTLEFDFVEIEVQNRRVVILEIAKTSVMPSRFSGVEYIRISSNTKKLKDYPEKERKLWRTFDRTNFEQRIAKSDLSANEVLQLLDFAKYF
ncbi:MAG: AlbA family DNA-binding domain-containing protein, partial [Anaerovoracaceae bacterium]